jgi:hypothetical protein
VLFSTILPKLIIMERLEKVKGNVDSGSVFDNPTNSGLTQVLLGTNYRISIASTSIEKG